MIVATTETLPNHEISETLGVVRGNVIRAKHIGSDFVAGLRKIVGGELTEYTQMIAEAREQAYDRMLAEADALGADAVVCMRFTTSTVSQNAAEVLAFGTAVRLRPRPAST
ncbi:MAG: heavy metal-binding domain-containing protein [Pacificimonas sp.]|jgi:uncharacterized protein YbjQ (UPF0145 family)|nr:heavy metal-binding domain-containing protein [Pacificimonas sp.]